jgi:hypothetical protein
MPKSQKIRIQKRVFVETKCWSYDDYYDVINLGELQVNLLQRDFKTGDEVKATIIIEKVS